MATAEYGPGDSRNLESAADKQRRTTRRWLLGAAAAFQALTAALP